MSLVNEVLQDLEARWHPVGDNTELDQAANDHEADTNENPLVKEHQDAELGRRSLSPGKRWLLLSTVLSSLVMLATVWLWQKPDEATDTKLAEPLAVGSVEQVLIADLLDVNSTSDREPVDLSEETIALATSSVKPLIEANQVVELVEELTPEEMEQVVVNVAKREERVESLLVGAENAFSAQRYRTPVNDNAYDLYQAVLSIQPNNERATAGLEAIKQAYLDLIGRVVAKQHYYKVPELAKSARSVGATQEDIDAVIAALPAQQSQPVREAMAKTKAYEAEKSEAQLVSDISGQDSVVLSARSRDQKIAQQSQELINSGQLKAAQLLLTEYLKSVPESPLSLQTLFNVHLQSGDLTEAEQLIGSAQFLPADRFSYLVAQLLVQRGDLNGALKALTSQSPELIEQPEYFALTAALYHKLGNNQMSGSVYQRLVAMSPENSSYWLGLAMSQDALQLPTALQSYERVKALTPKATAYSRYVDQRLQQLTPRP